MREHQPRCPDAVAQNPLAERVMVSHPEQAWSQLCNGVLGDDGALFPDGCHRPSPPGLAACVRGSGVRVSDARVSPARRMVVADTKRMERAMENIAYLHMLLLKNEPGFFAALELAVNRVDRELSGARLEAA